MNLKDQFWNDEKVIDFYFMYYHLGGLMNKTDLQAHIDIFKGPQLEPFFTPIYDGDELPDTTIDEHPMWLEVALPTKVEGDNSHEFKGCWDDKLSSSVRCDVSPYDGFKIKPGNEHKKETP